MTKKKILMKLNNLAFLLLFAPMAWSQSTTAKLGPVETSGLHRIYLEPEIRSRSQLDLNDFRIFDDNRNQVPYQMPSGTYDATPKFVPFTILSRESRPNEKTSIVVENPKTETTGIVLKIANAEVTKKFSISGSNDLKEWFGLVNARELSEISDASSTGLYKVIPLPRNAYRYLRFDIDDKKTLPLNVQAIGEIEQEQKIHRVATVKPAKITFEEIAERKVTRIHVQFDGRQCITHFRFNISAPNHYNRTVRQFKNVAYRYKKKDGVRELAISDFNLSSDRVNTIDEGFFESDFYFEIENRDNPPLKIDSIEFLQNLQWIVADLRAGEHYTVETGNSNMAAPDYDMNLSEEKLHKSLPEAKIAEIKSIDGKPNTGQKPSLWQKPWFLWTCIVIGALVAGYFAVSLVKDMKRE